MTRGSIAAPPLAARLGALGLLLVLTGAFAPARAQTPAPERWVLEFGPYAGHYDFDALTGFEDFAVFGLRLGVRMNPWLRFEGAFDETYTERQVTGSRARQVAFLLHARVEPWTWRVAPFALVGTGFVILDDADDPDAFGQAFDTGVGLRWNWRPQWMVRTEWLLRRQDYVLWRAVPDGFGGTVRESEAVTLWGRSFRLGLSYVF